MCANIRIYAAPKSAYCVNIAYVRGGLLSFPNVAESYKQSNGLQSVLLLIDVTRV